MKKYLAILFLPLLLAACGEKVEVPPAHVGAVLTKNGYKPELIPPSKFRLEACWAYCDRLVLVETADKGGVEEFRLFMPKDQLNMEFDIRFTLAVSDDPKTVQTILNRITAQPVGEEATPTITTNKVYETYGRPVVREVVRSVVAKYSINEVASSREKVNAEVYEAVTSALRGTPLQMRRLAFADIQFPDVITKAKELAAERRTKIEQAEAEKQIKLVQLQAELEASKAERAIRRERAEAAREENKIFAESVSDEYLKYKTLEVLEEMARNENTVFVPFDALDTVGFQQRVFTSLPDARADR